MTEEISHGAIQDLLRPVVAIRAEKRDALKHLTIPHNTDIRKAIRLNLAALLFVIHEDQVVLRHHTAGFIIPVVNVRVREDDRVALQHFLNRERELNHRIPLRHVHRFRKTGKGPLLSQHRVDQERCAAKRHLDRRTADQLDCAAFMDGFHCR